MASVTSREWRLGEANEASALVVNEARSVRDVYVAPRWVKVAVGVTSLVTVSGWFVAGQVFASNFNDNPAIAIGTNLAAGVLGRVTFKIILTPFADQKIYHYTTRYDHVIFQSLSILQQALKNTMQQRQIWFPVIFFHSGFEISGYVIFKSSETKGGQAEFSSFIEERPLLEGDTWGSREGVLASMKPFLVKTVALAAFGTAMAVLGHSQQSFTVWRLGWISGGMGLGMLPAQQLFVQLNRHRESLMRNLSSNLGPTARKVLALTVNLMPVLANVGICTAVAVSINAPSAAMHMDVVAAAVNLSAGAALACLDVAAQDRFQHPKTVAGRYASDQSIWSRCWEDIKRRPGDYVGIGLALAAEGGLLVSNVLDPSPGSTMDATIILATTVGTLALGYLVEALCPPSKNAYLNELNFRATRSLHLFNAVYLTFLTDFFLGHLSEREFTAMWFVYGALMGMYLKPNFDADPESWDGPSTTYLAEAGVTADGYVKKTL